MFKGPDLYDDHQWFENSGSSDWLKMDLDKATIFKSPLSYQSFIDARIFVDRI